jgi:hypothetical protein
MLPLHLNCQFARILLVGSQQVRHLLPAARDSRTKTTFTVKIKVTAVGLTRISLFEILSRSETRFLDPKFSRDFRETRESKLVAKLAFREYHRQKFRSENSEKRVSLGNFIASIASYGSHKNKFRSESCKQKFHSETRENHY